MSSTPRVSLVLLAFVAFACSSRTQPRAVSDSGTSDSGGGDAGATADLGTDDGGAVDMPAAVVDSGTDSSVSIDASPTDSSVPDSGPVDMGGGLDLGASPCPAMEAAGTGGCDFVLGYKFDGRRCVSVSGCECSGADCADLKPTMQECVDAQGACIEACGGRGGSTLCPTTSYCRYEVEYLCGATDGSGLCTERPDFCDDIFSPVCGCDGMTYSSECVAAQSGMGIRATTACEEEPAEPEEPAEF